MLNLYLEELSEKYKNYKFKKLGKFQAGIQAKTFKGVSEKNGIKQTRFIKKDFEDQSHAMREVLAYNIIEYVNKAYKASGFLIPSLPIPLDFDWEVVNDRLELSTSSVNTAKKNNDEQDIKQKLIDKKHVFMNALIGNTDAHPGNIVYKSKGRNYAIDFAYALYDHVASQQALNRLEEYLQNVYSMYRYDPQELKRQLPVIQKKIFFWNNFLRANKSNLMRILNKTGNEIISKYTDEKTKEKLREQLTIAKQTFNDNIEDLKEIYSNTFKYFEKAHKELNK
jgi:RIO-like serine/threonine protein kinase